MSLQMSPDADISVTPATPEIQAGETLLSRSSSYSVLEFIGKGCFGKVAKCQKLKTNETVAVKILRTDAKDTEKELSILKVISVLNPDICNVVKFLEQFEHMGRTCLAFEMLDRNLYELLQEHDFEPLLVNVIRPITAQLLVALDALKSLAILHTDIKPDNVMLVGAPLQAPRVKLIDFGLAIPASQVRSGLMVQPLGYRAPEVALGLPFTEAVDVWGVGCTLAFLYLPGNLFPGNCPNQMMKGIVQLLGQPEDHMLRTGRYTRNYFMEEETADGARWTMMTPDTNSCAPTEKPNSFSELFSSLDDLGDIYPSVHPDEHEDRKVFVDLLKQLLHLNGDQRISPREALQHPFITMSHLTQRPGSKDYRINSEILMSSCSAKSSPEKVEPSEAPKPHQEPTAGLSDEAASSVGVKAAGNSLPVSSAASKTLRKRIQRFFSSIKKSFSRCWCPAVED